MSLKGERLRRNRDRDRLLDTRSPQRLQFRAKLGDGQGNVLTDTDDRRYVNVYREDRSVITGVLNMRVSNINDLPVLVGYSDEYPGTLQILSVSWGDLGWETSDRAYMVAHGEQHTFHRDGDGGDDVVFIEMEQVLDGLVYPSSPAALTVDQRKCWYAYGTSFHFKDTETGYNLAASVPGAGLARWVLVYIDTTADPHALAHTNGDTYAKAFFPPEDVAIPDAPVGSVPLGAVFLEDTTATITWENVYSMRLFPMGVSGVMTSTAHGLLDTDVHDDVVDNAPTQGDLIYADGTPEWDALAIGGVGGVLYVTGGLPAWLALGNPGDFFRVNALGTAPEWQAAGTIAAHDLATHYEPLTNGDPASPALIFDGTGDVIMVEV